MIHLVLGKQGSGKTIFLVNEAKKFHKKGYKIYSNIHFTDVPYEPLNYKDIVECNLYKAVVFLDEIHLLLGARNFMNKINKKICDSFLSQARKQELEIYGTTQLLRKVDVRFREEADYIYECNKFIHINGAWIPYTKYSHLKISEKIPVMISVSKYDTYDGQSSDYTFIANDLFNSYDTKQIVKVEGLEDEK